MPRMAAHPLDPLSPISGLKIIVDMNSLEVLEIEDHHDYGLLRWLVNTIRDFAALSSVPISSRWKLAGPRASHSASTAMSCAGRSGPCGFDHYRRNAFDIG